MDETVNAQIEGNGDLTAERRKFVRLSINVEIDYSLLDEQPPDPKTTTSRNISAGGICMMVDEKLELNSVITLYIKLPEDHPEINAKGKVVWVKPFQMASDKKPRFDAGIEFIEISDDDKSQIKKYVFSLK